MKLHPTVASAACAIALLADAVAQTDWARAPLLAHHSHAACAFDVARGQLVLFGGTSSAGRLDATFEWNPLASWRRVTSRHAPAAREGAAAAFDAVRGVVVLFGGRTATGESAETWEWNGVDWQQRSTATNPPIRRLAAMVWQGSRHRTLMFGGRGAGFPELDDTWEYDGVDWTERSPAHRPGERSAPALAWDSARDRVVMFGGSCFALGPCWRMDTWEWDGVDWTDRTAGWPNDPLPRWSHGMAYDDNRGVVVLFGGSDEPGHYKSDTWEWDGIAWTQRTTVHEPIGRLGHGTVWDPVRQQMLVVGGETWTGLASDIWAFDGSDWQVADRGQQPGLYPLPTADAAWDGGRDVVVWFGFGPGYTTETWEWRAGRWHFVDQGNGPAWPDQHRLAWLPPRRHVILHQPATAGSAEQTWDYDGTTWTLLAPAMLPGVTGGFDLALDPRFDRLLLFGGRDIAGQPRSSTWLFDGGEWTMALPANVPPARAGHALALDAPRRRVALFGGRGGGGLLADTWEWDGVSWSQRGPQHAPSAREEHRMVFDCGRRRTVLHGGRDATGYRGDTWEWNGIDWTERGTPTGPPASYWQVLAFDATGHSLLHVVAQNDGTWRYGTIDAAAFEPFGNGCGGSLGTPALAAEFGQLPHAGVDFELALLRLPGTLALAVFGLSRRSWSGGSLPFSLAPFGFPGCALAVSPDFASALPLQNGCGRWTIAIPTAAGLIGCEFHAQAFALDVASPTGLAATPGTTGRVGGR